MVVEISQVLFILWSSFCCESQPYTCHMGKQVLFEGVFGGFVEDKIWVSEGRLSPGCDKTNVTKPIILICPQRLVILGICLLVLNQ